MLSGGSTIFQGIGGHMNEPTALAPSTLRSRFVSESRMCHTLRPSFFFFLSRRARCPFIVNFSVSPARLCFNLRIPTPYALTVVTHLLFNTICTDCEHKSKLSYTTGRRSASGFRSCSVQELVQTLSTSTWHRTSTSIECKRR